MFLRTRGQTTPSWVTKISLDKSILPKYLDLNAEINPFFQLIFMTHEFEPILDFFFKFYGTGFGFRDSLRGNILRSASVLGPKVVKNLKGIMIE